MKTEAEWIALAESFVEGSYVELAQRCEAEVTPEEMRELGMRLLSRAEKVARVAAYLDERGSTGSVDRGHKAGLIACNRVGRGLRKLFGYGWEGRQSNIRF